MKNESLARVLLVACAGGFGLFGAVFLVFPDTSAWVDIDLKSSTATTDIRAIFGGMELGLAVFVGWCSLRSHRMEIGATAATLVFAGMMGGRLLGVALDGGPSGLTLALTVSEFTGFLAGCTALWASKKT